MGTERQRRRQRMKVERVRDIDGNGLVCLVDHSVVDAVDLERRDLGFVTHHPECPVEEHITVPDAQQLGCRHVEFVALLDVTDRSAAQSEPADRHVRDVVSLRNTHGNRAGRLVDCSGISVQCDSIHRTKSIQLQVGNIVITAAAQSQKGDETDEKCCYLRLHDYHSPMFCV